MVIDLGRLPSQGRDLALRASKSTRHVPLFLVGGDAEKVERIKQRLPDAAYTTWEGLRADLKKAIAHPPVEPFVPQSALQGYGSTPLPKKLGIKANSVVALAGAPEGFEKVLGELPEGATLHTDGLISPVTCPCGSLRLAGTWSDAPRRWRLRRQRYKVCAIDATWSGLRFTKRQAR